MEIIYYVYSEAIFSILLCIFTIPAEFMVVLLGANNSLINPQMMLIRTFYFLIASLLSALITAYMHSGELGSIGFQIIFPFAIFAYGYLLVPARAVLNLSPCGIRSIRTAKNTFLFGFPTSAIIVSQTIAKYNNVDSLRTAAKTAYVSMSYIKQYPFMLVTALFFACCWFAYIGKIALSTSPNILYEIGRRPINIDAKTKMRL